MHPVFNVPQIPLPALFINELISILGEGGWREMTLHLALSLINIIPTLWCSWGVTESFLVSNRRRSKGACMSCYMSQTRGTGQDCVTCKVPVLSAMFVPSYWSCWYALSRMSLRFFPPSCPTLSPTEAHRARLAQKWDHTQAKVPKNEAQALHLCHPKPSTHSSVWALPPPNTCSPV